MVLTITPSNIRLSSEQTALQMLAILICQIIIKLWNCGFCRLGSFNFWNVTLRNVVTITAFSERNNFFLECVFMAVLQNLFGKLLSCRGKGKWNRNFTWNFVPDGHPEKWLRNMLTKLRRKLSVQGLIYTLWKVFKKNLRVGTSIVKNMHGQLSGKGSLEKFSFPKEVS